MEIKSKLYLVDASGEKFMGIGVLWLLKRVGETGSLRAAAAAMDISYSKAYKMVGALERQLGVDVVVRRKGGSLHEGSSLTEFGRKFADLYDGFQQEAKVQLVEPFERFSVRLEVLLEEFHREEQQHGRSEQGR